ncbi:hypothetical protein C2845_PM01G18480 [Panicum miliaceum]|uniref:Uncharacterized protein n=1 Tax=Panicum miliaceum TaxID=4540 RepID=A0A3L6TUH8_PANMI|nr:hypothetical protein C2845_PM01G18480 [Panicum miliaceum]
MPTQVGTKHEAVTSHRCQAQGRAVPTSYQGPTPRSWCMLDLPSEKTERRRRGFASCYRCQATPTTQQLRLHAAGPTSSRRPGAEESRMFTGSGIMAETSSNCDAFRKGTMPIAPPPLVQKDRVFTHGGRAGVRRPQQGTAPTASPSLRLSPKISLAQSSRQDAGSQVRRRHHRRCLDVLQKPFQRGVNGLAARRSRIAASTATPSDWATHGDQAPRRSCSCCATGARGRLVAPAHAASELGHRRAPGPSLEGACTVRQGQALQRQAKPAPPRHRPLPPTPWPRGARTLASTRATPPANHALPQRAPWRHRGPTRRPRAPAPPRQHAAHAVGTPPTRTRAARRLQIHLPGPPDPAAGPRIRPLRCRCRPPRAETAPLNTRSGRADLEEREEKAAPPPPSSQAARASGGRLWRRRGGGERVEGAAAAAI